MQDAAAALAPPDLYRLLEDGAFRMPPPPLPAPGATYAMLGARYTAGEPFVFPLSHFGVEQLYEEGCMAPSSAASAKSELLRMAIALRGQVKAVAVALADEGAGHSTQQTGLAGLPSSEWPSA